MDNKNLQYTLSLKDLFTGKMAKAVDQTKRMDNTVAGLGSKLKNLAIGFGVAGLAKSVLDTGASFERAEIQLKTLLKSADAAKATFNDLKNEATKSPFGFETLLQGNAALISTGISAKAAKEDFNALANAIAATGGTEDTLQRMVFNLQQIKNVGEATAVDIKQFGMAGINIYQLLNDYYKKNHIALKDQKKDYADITGALKLAATKGGQYFGALDNLANSTSGKLSNLADSAKNFAYELFNELKPAITVIVQGLTALMGLVIKLMPLIKMAVTLWGAYYIKLKLASLQSFNFALAQRAMAMGMSKSAVAAGFLSRGIRTIGHAIKAVPIIGWIALIVEGIMYLWDTFEGFRTSVYRAFETFINMGKFLAGLFTGLGNIIKGTLNGMPETVRLGQQQIKAGALSTHLATEAGVKKRVSAYNAENGLGGNASASEVGGSGGSVSGGAGGSGSLGTGTDVSSARPQSLIINISDGLVKQMNIYTTNLKEGSAKIREEVAKALLEVANDANLAAR